jgi:hypothetical protein
MVKRSFHSSAALSRAQPLFFISLSSTIANLKIRGTVRKSAYRVSGPLALGIRPGDANSDGLDKPLACFDFSQINLTMYLPGSQSLRRSRHKESGLQGIGRLLDPLAYRSR